MAKTGPAGHAFTIVGAVAGIIVTIGAFILVIEARKPERQRSISRIILGIIVAAMGGFALLLTILFIYMNDKMGMGFSRSMSRAPKPAAPPAAAPAAKPAAPAR